MSNQHKAFVGHSFTDDDKAVVQEFLNYFDQIKDMNIGFSWEHAEKAEPRALAEKVLRLMEDRNLFIGICTKKEAAIDPGKLTKVRFSGQKLKADKTAFTYKTSDWITQEIGIAIGRKMDLILLLENGVREPGGLQGNHEYIPFERDSPSKSFGKILEMISNLQPKASAVLDERAEIRVAPVAHDETQDHQTEDRLQPKDDWSIKDYHMALLVTIITDKEAEGKKIRDAFLISQWGQDSHRRESWEAMGEYFRILENKGGKLAKLETLAKTHSENADVQRYLALIYRKFDDHNRAATQFKAAAQKAGNKLDEFKLYGEAALSYLRDGQNHESDIIIAKMKGIVPVVENGEVELIKILREISETADDQDLYLGLTEKLLQLSPDDAESRFLLAYKYSQTNKDELALFHYLKIPDGIRGAAAWNNLGVGFDTCDLANKSVKAYRRAEELEETLAMSNLAKKLIKTGFLEEAEKICNRALKYDDCHKNIFDTISRIKDIPSEEANQEKTILDRANSLSEFYRGYGNASLQSTIGDHVGQWKGPLCNLRLSIKDNRLIATGRYMQGSVNALAAAFTGTSFGVGTPTKEMWYEARYEGSVFGRASKCDFTENAVDYVPTLLGGLRKTHVLMIIYESLREIMVYEKSSGKEPKFYSLKRID